MRLWKIILVSFLAGAAMFVWGFLSNAVMTWWNIQSFKNTAAVATVIKANAPKSGMYMIPPAE